MELVLTYIGLRLLISWTMDKSVVWKLFALLTLGITVLMLHLVLRFGTSTTTVDIYTALVLGDIQFSRPVCVEDIVTQYHYSLLPDKIHFKVIDYGEQINQECYLRGTRVQTER